MDYGKAGSIVRASDSAETGNANGGAVAHLGGSMAIEGTLFRTNTAAGGDGTERGAAGTLSAPGNGGAIFVGSGSLDIRASALVFNRADGGPVTSSPPWGATGGAGSGGGIYNAGDLSMILACLPSQTNVVGTIVDDGHNLCSDGSAKFTSNSSRPRDGGAISERSSRHPSWP